MVPVNETVGIEAMYKDSRGGGVGNEHVEIAVTSETGLRWGGMWRQ